MAKTILLQPVKGKFVQCFVEGRTTKIWLVNPDTNEQGTEVPYVDAIRLLALPHPVVCPAQVKGKDGKFIEVLTDEDRKAIAEKRDEMIAGLSSVPEKSSDDSTLKQLVETQAKLIDSQNTELETMRSEFAEMKAMFAEIQKANAEKKTAKKGRTNEAE